ncbi:hypothetical protein [Streptomyces anulatus]|uniref:hypothetical protein n=1 Tax=Streptomyces anulatus TaxID=1892 RepID=UPI003317792E
MNALALRDILGEREWAAATSREIRLTKLTDDQAHWQWQVGSWPEEGIEFMLHMWATVPEMVARVTSGSKKLPASAATSVRPLGESASVSIFLFPENGTGRFSTPTWRWNSSAFGGFQTRSWLSEDTTSGTAAPL